MGETHERITDASAIVAGLPALAFENAFLKLFEPTFASILPAGWTAEQQISVLDHIRIIYFHQLAGVARVTYKGTFALRRIREDLVLADRHVRGCDRPVSVEDAVTRIQVQFPTISGSGYEEVDWVELEWLQVTPRFYEEVKVTHPGSEYHRQYFCQRSITKLE